MSDERMSDSLIEIMFDEWTDRTRDPIEERVRRGLLPTILKPCLYLSLAEVQSSGQF